MTYSLKIKEKVKERYGKIALTGDSCCYSPSVSTESRGGCCSGNNNAILQPSQSAAQVAELVGYDAKELKSIPEESILGVGCGTPTKFAFIKESDTVVDLGSGAGIDVLVREQQSLTLISGARSGHSYPLLHRNSTAPMWQYP